MNLLRYFPDELKDRYMPKRQLGHGTMGRVYLAVERHSRALVAVKILPHCSEEAVAMRLEREAATLRRFQHPNVLRVLAFGTTEQGPYLVSEYLRGSTLEDLEGPQDVPKIAIQAARGLGAVHAEGLLHRDVKPANVFLTNKGRVVLMDFGLVHDPDSSRLTLTGGVVGTMHYMAPEVMRGEKASPACDWYAWGATIFFLAERKVPFTRGELIGGLTRNEPPPLGFEAVAPNSVLGKLLSRCLDWDAAARPKSAKEVAEAFEGDPAT